VPVVTAGKVGLYVGNSHSSIIFSKQKITTCLGASIQNLRLVTTTDSQSRKSEPATVRILN
jgi:hypothetical protein